MALVALAGCAVLCLAFRYLPMVDVPQHYAMVSIMLHHGDPAWGFAQRYTFDFFGRPYATVYWLGAALGLVMPLGAAMRIVIAACTVELRAVLFDPTVFFVLFVMPARCG